MNHPQQKTSQYFEQNPSDKKQLNRMICQSVFAKDYIQKLDESPNYNLSLEEQKNIDSKNSLFRVEMDINKKRSSVHCSFPNAPEKQTLENYQILLEKHEEKLRHSLFLDKNDDQILIFYQKLLQSNNNNLNNTLSSDEQEWLIIKKKIQTIKMAKQLFQDIVDGFDESLARYIHILNSCQDSAHIMDIFLKYPSCVLVLLGVKAFSTICIGFSCPKYHSLLKKFFVQINPHVELSPSYELYDKRWIEVIANSNLFCSTEKFTSDEKVYLRCSVIKDSDFFCSFIGQAKQVTQFTDLSAGILSGVPIPENFLYSKYENLLTTPQCQSHAFLCHYPQKNNLLECLYLVPKYASFSFFHFKWTSLTFSSVKNFQNENQKQWLFFSNILNSVSSDPKIHKTQETVFNKGTFLLIRQQFLNFLQHLKIPIQKDSKGNKIITLNNDQTKNFLKNLIDNGLKSLQGILSYNEMESPHTIESCFTFSFLDDIPTETLLNFKKALTRLFKSASHLCENPHSSDNKINQFINNYLYFINSLEKKFLKTHLKSFKTWIKQNLSFQKTEGLNKNIEFYHPIDPVSMNDLMKILNHLEHLTELKEDTPLFSLYKILFFTIHLPFCKINTDNDISFMHTIAKTFDISLEYQRWA